MKQCSLVILIAMMLLYGCSNDPKKQAASQKDYKLGNKLYLAGKLDSAYLAYSRYVNNADTPLKKGQVYRYMGLILWENGDLPGAEENLAAGIHTLDPSNETHRPALGYLYNVLGNVNLDLHHYDSAIVYYNEAIHFLWGDSYLPESMNGKATVLQKLKRYDEAIAMYDSIFLMKPTEPDLVARITDNRARTKWLQQNDYPALPEYWSALKMRVDSQDNSGLNASYAHLSDYYEKSNPDSALWYANKMLAKATENKSPADVLEAMDKLIRLNQSAIVKQQWYNTFKDLYDSLQLSRDTTRNRFAMIRYDVQKSKADNLELQQHISKQWQLVYGLIAFAVVSITGLTIWYRKRRKRIKEESENAIRASQLKTSQKVHDVVANGLYGVMNELEHSETIEREILLNKIEVLYERSRDISYEDNRATVNNLALNKEVHELLMAFDNAQTKVVVVGNDHLYWSSISPVQKKELLLVLNEIMVNMQKHSQAKNVALLFAQEEGKGLISYKDDGIGFPAGIEFGNGLNNTVNRIQSLHGNITFGKNGEHGALISISFPLQSKRT